MRAKASDPIEALRLKATRLLVVRRGRVVAETPARMARLDLPMRGKVVDPSRLGVQPGP